MIYIPSLVAVGGAIQKDIYSKTGLLPRFAPRNDILAEYVKYKPYLLIF